MSKLITLQQPRSAAAEAYRSLRTNLLFATLDDPASRSILLSSPTAKEDKSLALANLAVTLAQSDHRTLIVDADLRRPVQHQLWGLENKQGLTDVLLSGQGDWPLQKTEVPGLQVLTAGTLPANPADVLASKRMGEAMAGLRELADYILFDAPPLLALSDAAILSRQVGGVVLVVKTGLSRRDEIQKAQTQLDQVGARVLGVVMMNAPRSSNQYL
jgi:non-specific protein-tyrosine kinase